MDVNLEKLLQGLAFSNFYLQTDSQDAPEEYKVGIVKSDQRHLGADLQCVHIAPASGVLGFTWSRSASADQVSSIASSTFGQMIVTGVGRDEKWYHYTVHQSPGSFRLAEAGRFTACEYKELQSKR